MNEPLATLSVEPRETSETVVVTVDGEIDLSNADLVRRDLSDVLASQRCMILDLTQLDFFDSSGVAVLYELAFEARRAGRELVVVAPQDSNARRVLLITGFDTVVRLEVTVPL